MVDERDRERWDEAHLLARRAHDFIYKKPEGAPPEHMTMAEWLFYKYQQSMRWNWIWRFLLVQAPIALASMAAIYGAFSGAYEALQWLTDRMK